MSHFRDMMQPAVELLNEYMQSDATLRVPGEADTPVKVVLGKIRGDDRTDESGRQYRVSVRYCRIISAEKIRHDAQIVEPDDTVWEVDTTESGSISGEQVQLRRAETSRVQRPRYRGKP